MKKYKINGKILKNICDYLENSNDILNNVNDTTQGMFQISQSAEKQSYFVNILNEIVVKFKI